MSRSTRVLTVLQAGLFAASLACLPSAHAGSISEASRASINASIAIPAVITSGTTQLFRDAGQFSVTGIKTVSNVSVLAVRSVASGAEASLQVSSKVIEGSVLGVGTVLQATASATGTLLVLSGSALMFVPNEIGQSLLHHSRARESL